MEKYTGPYQGIMRVSEDDYYVKKLKEIINDSEFFSILDSEQKAMLTDLNNNFHGFIGSYKNRGVFYSLISLYVAYCSDKVKKVSEYKDAFNKLNTDILTAKGDIENISKISKGISGATVLVSYAKVFEEQAEAHKTAAMKWLGYIVWSIMFFVIFLFIIFFVNIADISFIKDNFAAEFTYKILIASLTLKVGLIFGYIQVVRFLNRNYNAEKHLEQVYLHRRNILQSLHAVYVSISDEFEKNKILTAGAITAFDRGETGYITTKEGAGSDDSLMQILLSKIK